MPERLANIQVRRDLHPLRQPASARRNVQQRQPARQIQTIMQDVYDDYDDEEQDSYATIVQPTIVQQPYIAPGSVPARASRTISQNQDQEDDMFTSSAVAPRQPRRWRTDEDEEIAPALTHRPSRAQAAQPKTSRRRFLGFLAGGCVLAAAGVMFGDWCLTQVRNFNETIAEGAAVSVTKELVCGHHDSAAHPTILHAYITDNRLRMDEMPGGSYERVYQFVSEDFSQNYTDAELAHLYLEIFAERVDNGKYQIRIQITPQRPNVFANPRLMNFLLVDSGKGYFVGVQGSQLPRK